MALGAALVGCRQKRVMENVRVQSAAIELLQDGDVVKSLIRVLVVVRVMMVSSFSASTVSRL